MKKLHLNLNDLQIESFEAERPAFVKPGSVAAFQGAEALAVLPTYDRLNTHCALSFLVGPGEACTPVCMASAHCVLTEATSNCVC